MRNRIGIFVCALLLAAGIAGTAAVSGRSDAETNVFVKTAREMFAASSWTIDEGGKKVQVKNRKFETACNLADIVDRRILAEYGAVFIAKNVTHPWSCVFKDDLEVASFQTGIPTKTATIGGTTIKLQAAAMDALLAATAEAEREGKAITPRGGSTAAARAYADTLRFWNGRFRNGLEHWMKQGRINAADAEAARGLGIREQIARVLKWEAEGVFFSTYFDKSILYSVAAPGTSQHLSLLALDVQQFGDRRVREILMKHGWFQTVKSDQPHFTYLGRKESELPGLGFKTWNMGDQKFWIPDFK